MDVYLLNTRSEANPAAKSKGGFVDFVENFFLTVKPSYMRGWICTVKEVKNDLFPSIILCSCTFLLYTCSRQAVLFFVNIKFDINVMT